MVARKIPGDYAATPSEVDVPWNAGHPAHPPSLRDGRGMTARQSAMPPLSYTTSTTAERQEEQDLGTARGASTASFPADFAEARRIYRNEAVTCLIMCVAFALAIGHLYIYPDIFGVEICPPEDVPELELAFFHHGWTAMLTTFIIELVSVMLKIYSTSY